MIDSSLFITDAQIDALYADGYMLSRDRERIRRVVEFAIGAFHTPTDPHVLADAIALRVDGPSVVFIRPTRELSDLEMQRVLDFTGTFRLDNVKFVFVPPFFELMAAGEAEMERLGWMRIPTHHQVESPT